MLNAALKIAVAFIGTALTAIFLMNAIRDASVLGYAKTAVPALVTIRLLFMLRKGDASATEGSSGRGTGKHEKLIAVGLAVGLGAPFLIMWLITSFVR